MYKKKEFSIVIKFVASVVISLSVSVGALAADIATMEDLGKHLFFDKNLSHPKGRQSCASCHDPKVGFTAPNRSVNRKAGVMPGAIKSRFGSRKAPTATYATFSADFSPDGGFGGAPEGGMFWDGRATGHMVTTRIFPDSWEGTLLDEMTAKDTAAVDQAMGPFLNDVEMNLPSAVELCERVASSNYVDLWERAWDEPINCSTARAPVDAEDGLPDLTFADLTHQRIAFAIGVFEDTLNTFSSKRDFALRAEEDGAFPLNDLTDQENTGHDLFYDRTNSCAAFCHSSSFAADGTDPQERYAPDASGYFNIGVPRNPSNPFYRMSRVRDDNGNPINPDGRNFVDLGLGGRDDNGDGEPDPEFEDEKGKFKIPTMRNLFSGKFPRAYFHNGYFKSLEGVVHFYNTRDMKPVCANRRGRPQLFLTEKQALKKECWPLPEVLSENIFDCDAGENCKVVLAEGETFGTYCDNPDNVRDIGNLCLTEEEEGAIVAYLKALTDTDIIEPPERHSRKRK